MVRRSTLNQKVVNCGGALILERPCAAVDIFNIINGVRTKQTTLTRGINPIKFILVICPGTVCMERLLELEWPLFHVSIL